MPLLWGDFRDQVNTSILSQTVGQEKWTETQMLHACWWALDTFAMHTAAATSVDIAGDGSTLGYPLPDNIFEPADNNVAVYARNGSSTTFYVPASSSDDGSRETIFWLRPETQINFLEAPSNTITVEYYAYYNRPYSDDDTIDVPRWAQQALGYLIAANVSASQAANQANIRQWGQKPDTGDPLDNPWEKLHCFFMDQYEREVQRFPSQKRNTTGIR